MNAPQTPPDAAQNPLLAEWTGPFGLPPFGALKPEHFRPAFDAALAQHRAEIEQIAADPAAPTFANTIEALERAGRALDKVEAVFFVLAGADTSDAIEEVERDVSPLLARHDNALYLNRALYARIADLHARRDSLGLDIRAGARARSLPQPFRARGRGAGKARTGQARRHQRTARDARDPVRPERARR